MVCLFSLSINNKFNVMKKLSGSKSSLIIVAAFLFSMLFFSESCNKSSYNNMTGMNGATGGTGGPGVNQVFIQGMAFNPSSVTVSVNTSITWINKDAVNHTVTSDTGLFDSGTLAANGTYSYTFTAAGTYSYHCKLHSSMIATIIVTAATTTPSMPSTPSTPSTTPGY